MRKDLLCNDVMAVASIESHAVSSFSYNIALALRDPSARAERGGQLTHPDCAIFGLEGLRMLYFRIPRDFSVERTHPPSDNVPVS
jgi:hypothetical protein